MGIVTMGEELSGRVVNRKAGRLLCRLAVLGVQFTTLLFMDPRIGCSGSANYTLVCPLFLKILQYYPHAFRNINRIIGY